MTLLRLVCLGLVCCLTATAQANTVTTATLREEVNDFLGRELAAHLSAIKSLDPPPFDRYSNEYARYVWEAAEEAGRKDILEKLRPSLKAQMRLWWDVISEDGYGYNWGRSQGVVSYLDTPEIAGTSIKASGDSPLGRGVHGAIPLQLVFESHDLVVNSGKPLRFKVSLAVS